MITIGENELLFIFGLSAFALLVFIFLLWRRRKRRVRLEQDPCGLWRYHKETQFERKEAYGKVLSKKEKKKGEGSVSKEEKSVAVISFHGDVRARQYKNLARFVDEVEVNKEGLSEVVVVIHSPGGMVSQYGNAFSQMERIREMGISLTVCVDVVAASGGYLMALPANKILAAPFAVVGSVGVMAFVPNVRNLLTSWRITPRTFTAGKYKQTISPFDDAGPEEVARFQGQLEAVHKLFLGAVKRYREGIVLEEIETGDHWTAQESVERGLGLVDEISTSDKYLLEKNRERDLVVFSQKKGFFEETFGRASAMIADSFEERLLSYWGRF